jgi:uncharacterized protein (DUF169 family)
MEDCWRYVSAIVTALGVENESVGVTFTDVEPDVEVEPGNYTVCGAILRASAGKIVRLSEELCACSGGKAHIGLTQRGEIPWKMLVEGEKLWCNVKTAVRSHAAVEKIAKPPVGLARTVFIYPVRAGLFQPDLVLMLVNAEQAARLITLNQFWDGKTPSFEMGARSAGARLRIHSSAASSI